MERAYYMLFTRESDGKWSPQFGDFVRKVVVDESRDSYREYKGKDKQIVKTTEAMSANWRFIASTLNNEVPPLTIEDLFATRREMERTS